MCCRLQPLSSRLISGSVKDSSLAWAFRRRLGLAGTQQEVVPPIAAARRFVPPSVGGGGRRSPLTRGSVHPFQSHGDPMTACGCPDIHAVINRPRSAHDSNPMPRMVIRRGSEWAMGDTAHARRVGPSVDDGRHSWMSVGSHPPVQSGEARVAVLARKRVECERVR